MTPQAERFISALTFSAWTGRPTQTQEQRSKIRRPNIFSPLSRNRSRSLCLFRQPQIQLDRLHTGLGTEPVSNAALSLKADCKRILLPCYEYAYVETSFRSTKLRAVERRWLDGNRASIRSLSLWLPLESGDWRILR